MRHSIFISAPILWHLQNVFSFCCYLIQISVGRKSLHLQGCMLHVGAQQYMMSVLNFLLPRAFTWHLPFSARRLRCASCRMKPIVPSVLLLKPENASAITIDSLCTPRECHHAFVYSLFPAVRLRMWAWPHVGSWILAPYLHLFLGKQSVLMQDLWLTEFKRGQNRLFLYL